MQRHSLMIFVHMAPGSVEDIKHDDVTMKTKYHFSHPQPLLLAVIVLALLLVV